jgi:hypothetical protein
MTPREKIFKAIVEGRAALSKRAGALHHPQSFVNAAAQRSRRGLRRATFAPQWRSHQRASTPECDPEVWLLISEKITLH